MKDRLKNRNTEQQNDRMTKNEQKIDTKNMVEW